jgi:hypothetical protein
MISFLLSFPPKSYMHSFSPHACYMPCASHPPWFEHFTYTSRRVKVMKLLIMPACQSALQPWMSLGLLYNQSPPGVRFLNKIIFYRMPSPHLRGPRYLPAWMVLLVVKLPPALLSVSQNRTSPTTTTRWRHLGGALHYAVFLNSRHFISLRSKCSPQYPYRHLWADCLVNVGASTFHDPTGLHRLLQGQLDLSSFYLNEIILKNKCNFIATFNFSFYFYFYIKRK